MRFRRSDIGDEHDTSTSPYAKVPAAMMPLLQIETGPPVASGWTPRPVVGSGMLRLLTEKKLAVMQNKLHTGGKGP